MPGQALQEYADAKEGNHKDTEAQSFSGPAQAPPGRQKRLPLCLGVFVVQRFFVFCDTLPREDDEWPVLSANPAP